MNDATRKRVVERADIFLLEKFETKPPLIEHAVFQDESDFPLQIPVNSQNGRVCFKDQKKDVHSLKSVQIRSYFWSAFGHFSGSGPR